MNSNKERIKTAITYASYNKEKTEKFRLQMKFDKEYKIYTRKEQR